MSLWLGVDMGGTATRWVARAQSGDIVARGSVAGATALPDAHNRTHYRRALTEIAAALPSPLDGAVLGVTGSGLVPDDTLRQDSARALALAPDRVRVLNDVVLAWHAAFPAARGHLISAGTGSVGVSIDTHGGVTLVGGRGTLIDDAGSGAWIGLRALDQVWRLIDLHGHPEGAAILAEQLAAVIGGAGWDSTQRWVYGGDRGRVAALAPAVAAAAEAGDPAAIHVLHRAGRELARLVIALRARCGAAPVGITGGVFALHPLIKSTMQAALPETPLHFLTLDVACHAALMAQTRLEAP